MKLSARNQIAGIVKSIKTGAVMAEVVVELPGGQEIVSVITETSVANLGIAEGKPVVVVIKATEVMLANED